MSEVTQDYIVDFLSTIQPISNPFLLALEEEAHRNRVPIISFEVKSLLEVLLSMHQPKKILEIGTAIGYSSILMSQYLAKNGSITTIDRYPFMIEQAKKNIARANLEDIITLLEGDAEDILPTLEPAFDFIFMDAAKAQYHVFLPYCVSLLRPGGILIADNVLNKGMIAQSRVDVPRRHRTTHKRLRNFIWDIYHHPELKSSILSIGDGIALCHKTKLNEENNYEKQ